MGLLRSMAAAAPGVAITAAALPLRAATSVTSATARTVSKPVKAAVSIPVRAATAVPAWAMRQSGPIAQVGAGVVDLVGQGSRRRVWSRNGRGYIEVRGRRVKSNRSLRQAVTSAVRKLDGVRWAEINAVTGELLVSFDERRVSMDRLVGAVSDVESARDLDDEPFGEHTSPADPGPLIAEAIALASDWMAFGVAATGRVIRWPCLPRGTRAVIALIDEQPRLRRGLEVRLGLYPADLLLALGNAFMHGLTQEPEALAVDSMYRLLLLSELRERRAVWCRREPELTEYGIPATPPRRTPRPAPLPPGPVEKYTGRAAAGALAGAGGLLALSGDPRAAGEIVLAAVPRAARLGRDGFAATLSRALARDGVIPLHGAAYRRLDRVTAILVDAVTLCGSGVQILSASDGSTWRIAAQLLDDDPGLEGRLDRDGRHLKPQSGEPAATDPAGQRVQVVDREGAVLGEVKVASELDPLAEAVLAAARRSGARVLLTEHAATAELLPMVDEVIERETGITEAVQRLQKDGHGVLLVTGCDDDAASAADVSLGVLRAGGPACWAADLVCGPGLQNACRLLSAVGAARETSRRSAQMALGGTSLAALLVVTGRSRGSRLGLELAPVHTAALMAMGTGALSAHRILRTPPPPTSPHIAWHALEPDTALRRATELAGQRPPSPDGGPDPLRFVPPAVQQFSRAVAHELRDPLTPVLVLGAAASAIVGSGVDAALVGGVTAGNALISGGQRMRAERALHGLLLGQRPPARRVRKGQEDSLERVPATELRIGDVIVLGPSDVVPADARLLESDGLEVDESRLTGESVPVAKAPDAVPGAELGERSCMVYEDTTVLTGQARAVVVATGPASQAGRAVALAGPPAPPRGVQAQLNELTRIALPATGVSGALVGALAFLRGVSVRQAISSGVSVAIAAVPEGLPLVATVAQLAAARRLSRRGILARTSRALGTLGRIDTLCFDKTGTLTKGELRVARLADPARPVDQRTTLGRRLLETAARTCPPDGREGRWHATDRAIVNAARTLRASKTDGWTLLHEIPFETSRGYAAAVGLNENKPYIAVKGAPEVVLPRCRRLASGAKAPPLTKERRDTARATVQKLATEGLRVLAVAEARPTGDVEAVEAEAEKLAETSELVLLGFIGIADTARSDAAPSIRRLTEAGVEVSMITGDHPATAQAVARELGIPRADRVLTGAELDKLSESDRSERIAQTSVFARVSPEQKVQIVRSLQKAGRAVAMIGDGSNDAAAIRLSDVGIGLSTGDSRAAPAAADLILPAADLPAIVEALLEGRAMWESVRNAVSILVGGNAGEVAFTIYGTAAGGQAPLSTRQLLLVNTLTDMLPALAIALAPPNGTAERAHQPDSSTDPLARAILLRGAVTATGSVLAWQVGRLTGRRRRASTIGLAALVTTQLAQTLQTSWHSPTVLVTSAVSMAALAAVIETPGVSQFFGCTPLGPAAWTIVLASTASATVGAALASRLSPSLGRTPD